MKIITVATLIAALLASSCASTQQATNQSTNGERSTATTQNGEVRDWSKVDINRDNLVSPAEMEAYLKANPGPLNRSASATSSGK